MDRYYNLVSYAKKALDGFLERSFVDENGNPIPTDNLTDPAAAAKKALTIEDTDNLDAVAIKLIVALLGTDYLPELIGSAFYGIPKSDYKQSKTGLKKQFIFSFKEPRKLQKNRKARNPKRMNISVNVEGKTIDIAQLQKEIIAAFPKPIKDSTSNLYYCGANKYSYFAPSDGLQITQLPSNTDKNAGNLIKKICNLFDIEYKSSVLKLSQSVEPNPSAILTYVALHKVVLIDGKKQDFLTYRPR